MWTIILVSTAWEAILLAQVQTQEVLLLMDEIRGRAEASSRSLVLHWDSRHIGCPDSQY